MPRWKDENTGLAKKLFEWNFADGVSDRTVVDDRRLTAEAAFNMAIQTVVACVHLSADEPKSGYKTLDKFNKKMHEVRQNLTRSACGDIFRCSINWFGC